MSFSKNISHSTNSSRDSIYPIPPTLPLIKVSPRSRLNTPSLVQPNRTNSTTSTEPRVRRREKNISTNESLYFPNKSTVHTVFPKIKTLSHSPSIALDTGAIERQMVELSLKPMHPDFVKLLSKSEIQFAPNKYLNYRTSRAGLANLGNTVLTII
jgi:hypothetical protein